MIKAYKKFLIFFLLIIFTLLFFLQKYNTIIEQNKRDILVANTIDHIVSELSYEKKHALSLAILFAKNQQIIDALKNNQKEQLQIEIDTVLQSIFQHTKQQNIQIQVHTKDLKVFYRSWEDKDSGLSLTSFRQGLVKVKQTHQPFVSNELGQRFNIKAISPIFDNEKYIGSLEVIIDYSSLKKRLQTAKIEVLPILHKEFLKTAISLKNNKKLHDYIVLEKEYSKKLYTLLVKNKEFLSQKEFYYMSDDTIITTIALGNIDENAVGYLVVAFQNVTEAFHYLPNYQYKGSIESSISVNNEIKSQRNITIK
ncbi:MAG: cache domain-containing protein [Arcobacteraceae bacterium]